MKLIIASSEDGDWEGLYINGELVEEGHSLNWRRVISKHFLGDSFYIESMEDIEVKGKWLSEEGSFPILLEELLEKGSKCH